MFDAKRMIGSQFDDETVMEFRRNWPFEVEKDGDNDRTSCTVPLKGDWADTKVTPEEISSKVLMYMKKIAERRVGKPVDTAVITVPAYFNIQQKEATANAAKIAGLNVLRLINEPTAAAMAAKFHQTEDMQNLLVFDFGGGTLDISILCCSEGILDVQSTKGDMKLGGRDLDNRLLDYCLEEFKDQYGIDLATDGDSNAKANLRKECEKAKILLSSDFEAVVRVDKIKDGKDLVVTISRDTLEERCEDLLGDRLLEPLEGALEDA